MGWFGSDERQAYDIVQNTPPEEHEGKFSHELISGAAAFAAEREYQKYEERNGKVENHQMAKDLLAGFAGAEADKLFETHGLNFLDRERAKHEAKKRAEYAVTEDRFNNYSGDGY
ncbi:hypothetical protein P389DRAFT_196789 [Cystobasidium minutum MCA 4210]|uniref:uncharacterized protein n=1 Tax=Cystobasidium minutum MCA 4210 TaxID=1397322 RepID=UPI0034CE9228|eukprot:jgi/Rhomi1/196789/gm1.5003_g